MGICSKKPKSGPIIAFDDTDRQCRHVTALTVSIVKGLTAHEKYERIASENDTYQMLFISLLTEILPCLRAFFEDEMSYQKQEKDLHGSM
jgi:hypothetical protein